MTATIARRPVSDTDTELPTAAAKAAKTRSEPSKEFERMPYASELSGSVTPGTRNLCTGVRDVPTDPGRVGVNSTMKTGAINPFRSGVDPSPICSATRLPGVITRHGVDDADGDEDTLAEFVRKTDTEANAEGDGENESSDDAVALFASDGEFDAEIDSDR